MNKIRLVAIGLIVLVSIWTIHFTANHVQQSEPISGHTAPAVQGSPILARSQRPNYPYSVIAGGAYSPGELKVADSTDWVVREHYSDFDKKRAKLVTLTDDRYHYVSYRMKDQVYWTKRKLRIPKGELLLTDDASYARARCGNRLSDRPHPAANSPHEPDAAILSLPPITHEFPRLALADPLETPVFPVETETTPALTLPLSQPGTVLETGGQTFVGAPVIAGSGGLIPAAPSGSETPAPPALPVTPGSAQPPPDVLPVPEPRSIYLLLFVSGAGLSFWAWRRKTAKDR